MVAMMLASFEDVRKARQCVHDLAQAAGLEDPGAAALVTGELGNNCVEHGNHVPGLLRIGCKPGALSLQFENACEQRPDWRTQKPLAVETFRTGGYGFPLARALGRSLSRRWADGRVVVRAEFGAGRHRVRWPRCLNANAHDADKRSIAGCIQGRGSGSQDL
jgi:anti-sigma regulatory factor (Ser/Thr protein kinase)